MSVSATVWLIDVLLMALCGTEEEDTSGLNTHSTCREDLFTGFFNNKTDIEYNQI